MSSGQSSEVYGKSAIAPNGIEMEKSGGSTILNETTFIVKEPPASPYRRKSHQSLK